MEKTCYDPTYTDGQVLGVDVDGCLICWNATTNQSYNCGETLDEYGESNLNEHEKFHLGLVELSSPQFVKKVDPSKVPFHARTPAESELTDIHKMGMQILEKWREGTVSSIEWVIQRFGDAAFSNNLKYGEYLFACRGEFVSANREINRLRIENARLRRQVSVTDSARHE